MFYPVDLLVADLVDGPLVPLVPVALCVASLKYFCIFLFFPSRIVQEWLQYL